MAADTDVNMKTTMTNNVNIDNYRKLVQNYLNLHIYQAALFWADKVVALSSGNPKDVYWLAQCMFHLKQYHRAAILLRSRNLDTKYILCNYLTVRCLLEANELKEALEIINLMDMEVFLQNSTPGAAVIENGLFDDTPLHQIKAAVLLLKGKILEMMDNRGLASDCFKEALNCDVYCFEAFDSLVKHQMLSAAEEEEILANMPISEQCTDAEADVLRTLYDCKRKKYHVPGETHADKKNVKTSDKLLSLTPQIVYSSPFVSTPNYSVSRDPQVESDSKKTDDSNVQPQTDVENSVIVRLRDSFDFAASDAERLYYNCDYQRCNSLTEAILKQDPYHSDCLPIHIACQVELKQSNKLFSLAHRLVALYPNLPISWFAVGCYYYIIGKSDSARRYLAKATWLDRLFGPAWLAYGHSFAIENEHDQAMAAYFKSSQLMKGCHLPLLYIGLECGLTNNVRLSMKFFHQALKIAPQDPFIMHEMGVIAFHNLEYKPAEKYFKQALEQVTKIKDSTVPQRWEPLLNNLGHTYRKLKKYEEALDYHKRALILCPQSASTYSAIAYVYALMGNTEEAVDWFHKALGLRRDDTFSTTMLNYVIEQLAEDQPPYPGAPFNIPDFVRTEDNTALEQESQSETVDITGKSESRDMSMSIDAFEIDMSDASGVIKE